MLCMRLVVQCAAIAACILSSSSAMWLLWPNMSITRAITNKWFSNPFTLSAAHSALACSADKQGLHFSKEIANTKTYKYKTKTDKIWNYKNKNQFTPSAAHSALAAADEQGLHTALLIQSGRCSPAKHRGAYGLWVYERSDCCSRTVWDPRMLEISCHCSSSYFVYNFSNTYWSHGVGCRIFKWISHVKDHKYLSGNKSLWTKVTNLTIHNNGIHGVLLKL